MSSAGPSPGVRGSSTSADRRSERAGRREQLLDAADRVVQARGSSASMNDIAAEAGITKPILYRHFGDKSGLYQALADRYISQLRERLTAALLTRGGLRARTRATVGAYLQAIDEQPQVYRFLVQRAAVEDPGVAGEVANFLRRFADDLAVGLLAEKQLTGMTKRQAQVRANAIAGMVQQTGDWWLDQTNVRRDTVVNELASLLLDGLLP